MEQNTSPAPQQDDATQQVRETAANDPVPQIMTDIGPETVEAEIVEEAPAQPSYTQELEQKLAEKEARLQATLVQYKEAKDEFEAARARLRRDITREIESGKRAMLVDILDVMDNLDRAIGAAQAGDTATDALLQGVHMVRDQFLSKLQGLGVTRLQASGKPFNPAHHEAVSIVPVTNAAQDGIVLGVVRDGYLIGDETLRYGMVAVGKFSKPTEPASDP